MSECEVCGAKSAVFNTNIGGIHLKACNNCAKSGKIVESAPKPVVKATYTTKTESQKSMEKSAYGDFEIGETELVDDFGKRIKNAREQQGLKQDELAQTIGEHVSVLHSLETQKKRPNENTAKKIEKVLKIKLYEVV